ncbi:MAG: PAS domain-containing protein [Thermoleophilaceae bacterium]|nr:PAS domain-containing protein [Thermoleophilaceae bacterium]
MSRKQREIIALEAEIAELRVKNGFLENAFDNLPAMIGFWDRDLKNVFANGAYLDFFGLTPEEIHGKHIRDVIGAELFELNHEYMGNALLGNSQTFDRMIIDASGHERHTQASYLPAVVDGKVQGFYVLVVDITARKAAEQRLAAQGERMVQVFDAMSDAVLAVDTLASVTYTNAAAKQLLMQATAPGKFKPIEELLAIQLGAEFPDLGNLCRSVIAKGKAMSLNGVATLVNDDGSMVNVDLTISPMDFAGEALGAVVLIHRAAASI